MFRARFSEAFPPKLINFGPQDIEKGVVDALPSPQVEGLLCALLGLVLNRKKPVEYVALVQLCFAMTAHEFCAMIMMNRDGFGLIFIFFADEVITIVPWKMHSPLNAPSGQRNGMALIPYPAQEVLIP
jgi:hypothetical protein